MVMLKCLLDYLSAQSRRDLLDLDRSAKNASQYWLLQCNYNNYLLLSVKTIGEAAEEIKRKLKSGPDVTQPR